MNYILYVDLIYTFSEKEISIGCKVCFLCSIKNALDAPLKRYIAISLSVCVCESVFRECVVVLSLLQNGFYKC
jgi:hypothetical protein